MEIPPEQQKKLQTIGQKYHLKLLLLHGSFATGKQRPGSDLDIAYLPSQALELHQQLALHSDLADIFGDNYERELDLKSLRKTNPLFQYEVTRDSQLLYGNDDTYLDFRIHAEMMYHDTQDLRDLENLQIQKMRKKFNKHYAPNRPS